MDKQQIIENNKLLAEFLGYKYYKHPDHMPGWRKDIGHEIFGKTYYLGRTHKDLKFHLDWNWLMMVIDKIESITVNKECRFNIILEQCFCTIIENHTSDEILEVDGDTKIEAAYYGIVEFVKWFNNNK